MSRGQEHLMAEHTPVRIRAEHASLRRWSPQKRRNTINGLLFAAPWIVGLALFWIYPILASFYYSFTDFNAIQNPQWVGLQNYTALFQDNEFLISAYNTLYFAVLSIPLAIVFAFGLALLLNMHIRGRFFYRTVYFLPTLVPSVALSLVWIYLFNPATGLVNVPFDWIGIRGPCWNACEAWARPTMVLLALWVIGGQIILYLAGLQDVPQELYDAAAVDGANVLQKFRAVTLPMMTPVVFFHLITSVIGAFQFFDIPFIMTNGTGQPSNSLLFYSIYLYKNAFAYFKMGYASAMAWLMFLAILLITLAIFRSARYWVYYGGVDFS
jgi:multiple sugar transport system permease protein